VVVLTQRLSLRFEFTTTTATPT